MRSGLGAQEHPVRTRSSPRPAGGGRGDLIPNRWSSGGKDGSAAISWRLEVGCSVDPALGWLGEPDAHCNLQDLRSPAAAPKTRAQHEHRDIPLLVKGAAANLGCMVVRRRASCLGRPGDPQARDPAPGPFTALTADAAALRRPLHSPPAPHSQSSPPASWPAGTVAGRL